VTQLEDRVAVRFTALYQLDREMSIAEVIDGLAATPKLLREVVSGVDDRALTAATEHGEWSPLKVCCHFRDIALVYSARFRWMVFDDNPLLPNYSEDAWVEAAGETAADLPALLDSIAALRADLARMLRRLPAEAWTRTGRHELIGEVVLEPYVRHQLAHEEQHLAQLKRALGR
jgi:hypothetical protein